MSDTQKTGDAAAGTSEATGTPDDIKGLDDNARDILRRYNEQREAATKEAATAKRERDALLKEKTERETAEKQQKEKAAEAAGEFETLAKTREAERDAARTDAAALKAENDQLRKVIDDVLEAEWKDLSPDALDAFVGNEDDPLARLAFLPKGKRLTAKLAEKAEALRGNGRDPVSAGGKKTNEDAARKATSAMYRNF